MESQVQLNDMPWTEVNEYARQKSYDTGTQRIRLLELKPGFEETTWCHKGHIGYIIDGLLEVDFKNSDKQTYHSGDVLILSSGQEHKAKTTDKVVTLFLVDD